MISIVYVLIIFLSVINICVATWLINRNNTERKEIKQGLDVNSPAYEAALYAWVKEQTKR